jgi:GntR family transcriptional regulator
MITRPEYRDTALLPDEVSLSSAMGISRNTLRHAIAKLVAEGRLERKAGIGTRVVEPRVESGIGAWHSFTREMAAKGIQVETYRTRVKSAPATADVAKALRLAVGTPVLCVERVRGWDQRPEVHFRSFLHPRLGLARQSDFSRPWYELIHAQTGTVADMSHEEISAVAAPRWLAKVLEIKPGTPVLRRVRTVLDAGRRPLEFALVHYLCDRFQLTLSLRRK